MTRRSLAVLAIPLLAIGFCACASLESLARKGNVEGLKKRLDAGESPDNDGCPICEAAWYGELPAVKLLLDRGATIDKKGRWGETALELALREQQWDVAKLLIVRGADVDWRDTSSGRGPLVYAAESDNKELVKLLIDYGADPLVRTYGGDTPRAWAKSGDIIEMLRKAEAEGPEKRAMRRARLAKRKAVEAALAAERPAIETAERAGDQAKAAGKPKEALARYRDALKDAPPGTEPDFRLRGKIIALALAMSPPPAIPDEVQSFADRGQGIIRRAENQEGLGLAVAELRKATLAAPWWATGYFNLGLALEKTEDYDEAIQSFKLYLAAAPDASDAKAVRRKIDDLIGAKELAERK